MLKMAKGPGRDRPKNRDLDRTKRKILAGALREFVARGFAGARTRAIAKRAGVHEWMVFYCFGSKHNLYREVMRERLAQRTRMMAQVPDDLAAAMQAAFVFLAENPDVIRLFQWEALTASKGELLAAEERREVFQQVRARLQGFQSRGVLPPNVDAELIWLSMAGLAFFPFAFPQLVKLATGLEAKDSAFQERWAGLLRRFVGFLACGSRPIEAAAKGWTGTAPAHLSNGEQSSTKA